jgi:hypothetical protein
VCLWDAGLTRALGEQPGFLSEASQDQLNSPKAHAVVCGWKRDDECEAKPDLVTHWQFSISQTLNDMDPVRMSQGLEYFRFKSAHRLLPLPLILHVTALLASIRHGYNILAVAQFCNC